VTLPDGYTPVPSGKIAAVVTHLEMRRKPVLEPVAAPADLVFRRVPAPELDWYRTLFRRIGEHWLWFSRLRLSDEQLARILQDDRVEVFAMEQNGRAKGLLELDRREFPDVELTFFGLTPDLIGRGAGRYMMRYAIERAWSYEPRRLCLQTCTLDHPRALQFYMKAGFTPYKRSIEIGDDPRLTGHLPGESAPQIPRI
jgi:GNAT superfamily N-acetyltransferase